MTGEQAKALRNDGHWKAFEQVLLEDIDGLKEELVSATGEDALRVQEKIKTIRLVMNRLDYLAEDDELDTK